MITIREIAAIAGVSRSTVSLVLNNSPLVKAETREKVLAVIQDTGYVPNSNARNLSWRATKCLGIVILSDQKRSACYDYSQSVGLFSLNVMQGLIDRLADSEYSVIIEYFLPSAAPARRSCPSSCASARWTACSCWAAFWTDICCPTAWPRASRWWRWASIRPLPCATA